MKRIPQTPVSRRLFLGGVAAAGSTAVVHLTAAQPTRPAKDGADMMHHWNSLAVDAVGLDHTPAAAGESRATGEQLGPGRSSWAMAIVHIAIFEAVNAVAGKYRSYAGLTSALREASIDAAIAQAAHDALNFVLTTQSQRCDQQLDRDLAQIPDGQMKSNGIDVGRQAAAAAIAMRTKDGASHSELRLGIDFLPSDQPGKWRQDPISQIAVALGARWSEVKPFVLDSGPISFALHLRQRSPAAGTSPPTTKLSA